MRIGIITIHRIINFGSALQAYALQHYLEKTTEQEIELIDYVFPNSFHKKKKTSLKIIRGWVRITLDYLFEKKWTTIKKFHIFHKEYFKLSKEKYPSLYTLNKRPPIYDIYITGSDQVWNPKTLNNDPCFYLCFAPKEKKKIAFSASFTITRLDDKYKPLIKKRLSEYKYIGIREKKGIDIIKDLHLPNNILIMNTCDPTLLLTQKDYDSLIKNPDIHIEGHYILVYMLMYAFNPYPALEYVLKELQDKTGYNIVVIGDRRFKYHKPYQFIKGIGPSEFLWLVKHASYIVTSSFHGTMFSLIYRKPFYAISPHNEDSRIKDILEIIKLDNRIIFCENKTPLITTSNPYTLQVESLLTKFISSSKDFLGEAIKTV